jgi:hypothetical protein
MTYTPTVVLLWLAYPKEVAMSAFVLLAFAFGLLIGLTVSAIVLVVFIIQNEKRMAELDAEIAMLEADTIPAHTGDAAYDAMYD